MSDHASGIEMDTGLENVGSINIYDEEIIEMEVEGNKYWFLKREILQFCIQQNLTLVEVGGNAALPLPLNSENEANSLNSEDQEVDSVEIPQTINDSSHATTILPIIDPTTINWSSNEDVIKYIKALLFANPGKRLHEINDQDERLPEIVKKRIRHARLDFKRREGIKEKIKNLESENKNLRTERDAARQESMGLRSQIGILTDENISLSKKINDINTKSQMERKELEQKITTLTAILNAGDGKLDN